MNLREVVAILRNLDGILYAGIVLLLLLPYNHVGYNEFNNPRMILLAPIIALCWFSLRLPADLDTLGKWRVKILQCRRFTYALMGLSPFPIWWAAIPNNAYLFVNLVAAALAGFGWFYQLYDCMLELAIYNGYRSLERQIRILKWLLFYVTIVPFLSLSLMIFMDSYIYSSYDFVDILTLVKIIPAWMLAVYFFPLLYGMWLIIRLRRMLNWQIGYLTNED